MLRVKRVYEPKQAADGVRILVDSLWPRGLAAAEAGIDEWLREIAPGAELRRWFGHQAERWLEFRRRYAEELHAPPKAGLVERIARMALSSEVTLVYAARDTEHNNARVLEEVVTSYMKELPRG